MTLADALGLGADLCPRWRQSSNQSYSARRVEAQRAAVVAPKRHSIWGKCISEPSLPSSALSLPRGALCEERPSPRLPLPLHPTDTCPPIHHPHYPPLPTPPLGRAHGATHPESAQGTQSQCRQPWRQPSGKGKEVTQEATQCHRAGGRNRCRANKNKGRGWQILQGVREGPPGGLEVMLPQQTRQGGQIQAEAVAKCGGRPQK